MSETPDGTGPAEGPAPHLSQRVARFKIRTHIDGQHEATVELREHASGEDFTVLVWPKHSRREYSALLSDVAQIVVARHVKAMLASQGKPVPKARR